MQSVYSNVMENKAQRVSLPQVSLLMRFHMENIQEKKTQTYQAVTLGV